MRWENLVPVSTAVGPAALTSLVSLLVTPTRIEIPASWRQPILPPVSCEGVDERTTKQRSPTETVRHHLTRCPMARLRVGTGMQHVLAGA
jgi:hypothetical protein